jgi:hypothetical protein
LIFGGIVGGFRRDLHAALGKVAESGEDEAKALARVHRHATRIFRRLGGFAHVLKREAFLSSRHCDPGVDFESARFEITARPVRY